METVPLHIIHLDQDDPKKCTARKMSKFNLVKIHTDINRTPKRGFLLNPKSPQLLGPDDKKMINYGASIVALDCSWKQIDTSLDFIQNKTQLIGKSLPLVLAANEVSWGKPGRLSTVEAFALSLLLLDKEEQAKTVLRPFKFGSQFLELNVEPINAYKHAKNNTELENLQWEFFNKI